jgi:hydrophobe/amphiphile efflux-1 (HAE1) family protein
MMNLPRHFIERPVQALLLSMTILIGGLAAFNSLDLRQYPQLQNTVISVSTGYPGASAELMQDFVTNPIQEAMAGAQGIDFLTSTSSMGSSTVEANLLLGYDANAALTDIMAKVQQTKYVLPAAANNPVITSTTGDTTAIAYISYASTTLTPSEISEYLDREVKPKFATIEGVAQAQIFGNRPFAMRIWLNTDAMAALGVTPDEVRSAIVENNVQAAAGEIEGYYDKLALNVDTTLHSAAEFGAIFIRPNNQGGIIRLRDIATIELGTSDDSTSVYANGEPAVFIGIQPLPTANPLDVVDRVVAALLEIERTLPPGVEQTLVYDQTIFISASIDEVQKTIIEAALIVVVVILLFLGSFRAVLVPIATIPLSLVGVCVLLLAFGFTLNLLTLLAMVLAIGLVVDDAIVVVENVHRHLEDGLGAREAAIKGSTEIVGPVISMTITLAAVYAPIAFVGGLTGNLFKEFALALAGAVIVSGVVALTLSPAMCAYLFKGDSKPNAFASFIDRFFERLRHYYERRLESVIRYRPAVAILVVFVLSACAYLYATARSELAPQEDQGSILVSASVQNSANIDYLEAYTVEMGEIMGKLPYSTNQFVINGLGGSTSSIGGVVLENWDKRPISEEVLEGQLTHGLSAISGLQAYAFSLPPLPGSSGLPVQVVITTTRDYRELAENAQRLLVEALESGLFGFAQVSLKFDQAQLKMSIDRDLAADLGVTMQSIGSALSTMLSGNYVSRFSIYDRSYEVIPQVPRSDRMSGELIGRIHLRTEKGEMVPLSAFVSFTQDVQPSSLPQFNQQNSTTLEASLAPGVSLGQALGFIEAKAGEILPAGYNLNYKGESRQFTREGDTLLIAFAAAVVVIFMVLAAQLNSLRDPIVILISVPMSIAGALVFINLGVATINIYTQVGLVTMIGLISKHGILMVEFAARLREEKGISRNKAIVEAASIRLRPVLMTTTAMVVGVTPLLFATGAGSNSRFDIGLVIATGMTVGTCFTLFVVPAMYTYIGHPDAPAPATADVPKEAIPPKELSKAPKTAKT